MSKQDLAAYEKQVDKLVASCVDDIGKEVKHCKEAVLKRAQSLVKEIRGVKVSKGIDEKELNEIPDRIEEIVKKNNAKLKEGLVELRVVNVTVDVKEKEVWVAGSGIGGTLAGV